LRIVLPRKREAHHVKILRSLLFAALFLLGVTSVASGQDEQPAPNPAAAPPKMVLLVHQQVRLGKAAERQRLEIATAREYDQLEVPVTWIELESISGPPEALFFDPFDSFEQLDQDFYIFGMLFAGHPELLRMQEDIKSLLVSENTLIAVRRDDLGYRPQSIDLSKARFLRVLEVQLRPGYERAFVESFTTLAEAYERINTDTPWVVYQVNVGTPSPTFLVFVPMRALKQNDDLLNAQRSLRETEGEESAERLEQTARDAYAFTESNLYVISPQMSHVSREFVEGDKSFWTPKPGGAPAKTAPRKDAPSKPEQ
jgi:hypothetical protein